MGESEILVILTPLETAVSTFLVQRPFYRQNLKLIDILSIDFFSPQGKGGRAGKIMHQAKELASD